MPQKVWDVRTEGLKLERWGGEKSSCALMWWEGVNLRNVVIWDSHIRHSLVCV